jgi:RNA-dependent RNA polymerase
MKPVKFTMSDGRAALALKPDWQTWESLAINLFDVPNEANAKAIWAAFKSEGALCSIDLFEDYTGKRNGKGRVRFR